MSLSFVAIGEIYSYAEPAVFMYLIDRKQPNMIIFYCCSCIKKLFLAFKLIDWPIYDFLIEIALQL